MHRRARALSLALPTISLLAGTVLTATPASAAVQLPSGCTFNKTTGITTCITTKQVDLTQATDYAADNFVQGWIGDGSAASFLCTHYYPAATRYVEDVAIDGPAGTPLIVSATGITTTTTTYQGVSTGKGSKLLTTTTSTTVTSATVTQGRLYCEVPDRPGQDVLTNGASWSV